MRKGKRALVVLAAMLACACNSPAVETNRTERGTLMFEYGSLVFTTSTSTNRYPLADKRNKNLIPLPGLSVVRFDEIVLTSKDGDTKGVLTLHLRTSTGSELALNEHEPLAVVVDKEAASEGGRTNGVWVWRLETEGGLSNGVPQYGAARERPR